MNKDELKKIHIRGEIDDKIGSYSLQELIDAGDAGNEAVVSWLGDKLTAGIVAKVTGQSIAETEKGVQLTEENLCGFITYLENDLGVDMYRIEKEPKEE